MNTKFCIQPPEVPAFPMNLKYRIHREDGRIESHYDNGMVIHRSREIDEKKLELIEDLQSGQIVDYHGVTIEGYLSPFGPPEDRQGDIVQRGAFRESIEAFKLRGLPLLVDHQNKVASLAGRFTSLKEDSHGLRFTAEISNAPGLADLRIKIVEGHVRTVSMGGRFYFDAGDGKTITKVDLFEGSIVSIPAADRAVFSLRAADSASEQTTPEPEGEGNMHLTPDQRRTLARLQRGVGKLNHLFEAVGMQSVKGLSYRTGDDLYSEGQLQWDDDLQAKFKSLLESAIDKCPDTFAPLLPFNSGKLRADQRKAFEILAATAKSVAGKMAATDPRQASAWHKLGRVLWQNAHPFQTK